MHGQPNIKILYEYLFLLGEQGKERNVRVVRYARRPNMFTCIWNAENATNIYFPPHIYVIFCCSL
jgi:hypothetical protein